LLTQYSNEIDDSQIREPKTSVLGAACSANDHTVDRQHLFFRKLIKLTERDKIKQIEAKA